MQTLEQKQQALQAAIENLYKVFGTYQLRGPVLGCSDSVTTEDEQRLAAKPLREIEAETLRRYMRKAMVEWGDEHDFKHFLPRFLELLASRDSSLKIKFLLKKLKRAHWQDWPEDEKAAIRHYWIMVWQFILECEEGWPSHRVWLEASVELVGNVTPFLQVWEDDCSLKAWRSLLWFVEGEFIESYEIEGYDTWPYAYGMVIHDWLLDDERLQQIEQRFCRSTNDEEARTLAAIIDALTLYREGGKTDESPNEN